MTFAVIRTHFVRLHCWPDAPKEVGFLRSMHRHVFFVTVKIQQFHDDRDLEYFIFKAYVDQALKDMHQNNNDSCEMIGQKLLSTISKSYPERVIEIEVSEDGENGAIVTSS